MAKYPPGKRETVTPKFRRPPKDPGLFLLRTLLAASPRYVSGTYLASGMKMSRVGVWSRVNKLRLQGIVIEAARNRGYRLAEEPLLLNQSLLDAHLDAISANCPCLVFDTVDSTNSQAERLLNNDRKTPFAVFANQQEKGRGRLGFGQLGRGQPGACGGGLDGLLRDEGLPHTKLFRQVHTARWPAEGRGHVGVGSMAC